MDINIAQYICNKMYVRMQDIRQLSPLTLAYIGDGIYDIIIRTMIVEKGNAPVNKLHNTVSGFVKAQTQMEMITKLEERLTEEEHDIYKRGRNAKSYTSAKNASKSDYRMATGFEALIGYLYLKGDMDRIMELVKEGISLCDMKK